jgi:tight adherence protein C
VTVVLAALAGALAAAGIVELTAALAARPRTAPRRSAPAVALTALLRVGRGLGPARESPDLQQRIDAAGVSMPAADILALKAGSALVALLACAPLYSSLPGRLGLLALLAVPTAGLLAPDLWLRRRTRARGAVMDAELADVLDLLRVAVSAGLPAGRALEEVGRRHPGMLAAELRRTAAGLALGVRSPVAYEHLSRRSPVVGVQALVVLLSRAARHGAPLSGSLAALAADARATRARRTAERAAKAAPKIQLVVALLIVPSVLLLVAAALAPSLLG